MTDRQVESSEHALLGLLELLLVLIDRVRLEIDTDRTAADRTWSLRRANDIVQQMSSRQEIPVEGWKGGDD